MKIHQIVIVLIGSIAAAAGIGLGIEIVLVGAPAPQVQPNARITVRKAARKIVPALTEKQILDRVAYKYNLDSKERKLLHTIRRIENGRPGLEMGCGDGILGHPARRYAGNFWKSLDLQARYAAGTIADHYDGDIDKFARRYCPVNARNWARMAKRIMAQG